MQWDPVLAVWVVVWGCVVSLKVLGALGWGGGVGVEEVTRDRLFQKGRPCEEGPHRFLCGARSAAWPLSSHVPKCGGVGGSPSGIYRIRYVCIFLGES